ncbi:hypothetical protein GCM10010430_01650 [Kitasatospora cystarginea]|uniref:Uncharacterized protein n=1 Tax=Kitasatospora cystarginea TaxID=58350 RepID=A0ABP5Q541_9ACTN
MGTGVDRRPGSPFPNRAQRPAGSQAGQRVLLAGDDLDRLLRAAALAAEAEHPGLRVVERAVAAAAAHGALEKRLDRRDEGGIGHGHSLAENPFAVGGAGGQDRGMSKQARVTTGGR